MKSRASLLGYVVRGFALLVAAVAMAGCASDPLPPPGITSLKPSSATAGGPSFTLKVIGTGFLSTDVVLWNGAPLATQPVSSTELDAQVPSTLIQSAVIAKTMGLMSGVSQSQAHASQAPADKAVLVIVFRKDGSQQSNPMNFAINPPTPQAASLTIAKTHSGNFTQGQQGTYTVTVSNGANAGSTSGTVTVTDTVPTGETLVSMAGTGWTCVNNGCTRSDVLAGGASYPAMTVTVNVAANAPSSVTNSVAVSGGGDPNSHTANDPTTITTAPTASLTITKTHTDNFTQGQTGATYTIVVGNQGAGSTSGMVTLTDTVPNGLTATAASGTGWTCTVSATVTCMRSDPLAATGSYPAITLTVNVASNAPSSVTNTATVSGGGDPNSHTANDTTIIVSTPTGAVQITFGNGDDFDARISGDPLISFSSLATNLVPNDTNGQLDVFVACVVGGAVTTCPTPITRVSLTSAGAQIPGGAGPSPSTGPTSPTPISGDGRFVVFASSDPNVVTLPTPNNGALEIYVRDTCVGASGCTPRTFLASENSTGTIAGSQDSKNPSISANGRVVAFFSGDFNLAPPASGFQIYARDTCFGTPAGCVPSTVLVSADNSGLKGNLFSNNPSVSGDGRFVAFESNSNNLVPTASSIQQQVFLRDTCIGAPAGCTPATTLISANSTGSPSNSFNQSPSVNSDGRFVVFFSQASDILPGNTAPGRPDVFLRDTCGGSSGPVAGCTPSTTRVSIALDGTQANAASITGGAGTSISTTGRFVAFGSGATNLLPTPSTAGQVYVLDTCFGAPAGCTRALHKVTVDSNGNEVGSSGQFALSGDGKFLAFTQLVGTAPNQIQQIFLALTGF